MKELVSLAKAAEKYSAELGVRPDIHMDDFIFQFLIGNESFDSHDSAVKYYFYDGRKSAHLLAELLVDLRMSDRDAISMLEFASGYGCVTRHLPTTLPYVHSVACDIHSKAVEFIRERLGGEAILSHSDPGEFAGNGCFDIVFALSFFSHMPRETWSRWLSALYGAVAPGGALIFTTQGLHSAKFFGEPNLEPDGFWFLPDSEQKDLDVATYGQTIVSVSFVRHEIEAVLRRPADSIREAFWWGHQDCYIVHKM